MRLALEWVFPHLAVEARDDVSRLSRAPIWTRECPPREGTRELSAGGCQTRAFLRSGNPTRVARQYLQIHFQQNF